MNFRVLFAGLTELWGSGHHSIEWHERCSFLAVIVVRKSLRARCVHALRGLVAAFAIAGLAVACSNDDPASPPAEAPSKADEPFLTTLDRPSDLTDMTAEGDDGSVKYLARVEGKPVLEPLTERCYFQNMKRHTWHVDFIRSFPGLEGFSFQAYQSMVLRQSSRRLWGGSVKSWPGTPHPSGGDAGVVSYTVYSDGSGIDVAAVVEVDRTLKACAPFAKDRLVYVPDGPAQLAFLTRNRQALADEGVASLFPENLVDRTRAVVYSAGEGYGTLRVVPRGQPLVDYGPHDVVVVESVPNDISVVAGLVSRNPQNELGHVNLRLREKGIPNAALPVVYESDFVRDLTGHLVHVVVTESGVTVTEATLDEAEAFWDAHRPTVPDVSADLSVTALTPFTELRARDASAFGAKAGNLGELTRVLDAPSRTDGFGIPFSAYARFMEETGLRQNVEALLTDPELRTNLGVKRARLAELRDVIEAAPFPPALAAELEGAISRVYGAQGNTQYLRFRSSTNVEDKGEFTGAGLYDSKSGCLADDLDGDDAGPSHCLTDAGRAALEADLAARKKLLEEHLDYAWLLPIIDDLEGDLTREKPVARAVRKVWASLWNERAFDEREYYGIEHRDAYMGIAVNPTFVVEQASGVAVSNLLVDDGPPLYQLNSQAGSESVVRPEDPTAVAELLTFRRAGEPAEVTDVNVQVRSNRVPDGARVWSDASLAELGRLLFRVHDHFAAEVYPELAPLHLDFEVKLDAAGHVVIKQVRPLAEP